MKTNSKMLRPELVLQRKRGGQPGNQNARKDGRHDAPARALRSRIAKVRKRAKALILQANEEVKRKHQPQ